jgi:hypothetical protein
MHTQRRALDAASDARERLGPAVSWMLDQPFVSPAYRRVRSRVFDWYEAGESEKAVSRDHAAAFMGDASEEGLGFVYDSLDLNVITDGFDVSPLIQNLELNDIIVQSTGGMATEALDLIRAQGVTVDAIVHGIAARIFRHRSGPPGPPGRYGMQQQERDRIGAPGRSQPLGLTPERP